MDIDKNLLDTVVEKFGTKKDVWYIVEDDDHFTATTTIGVSDQFFSWITGFGERAKIIEPEDVVSKYLLYLHSILEQYKI